MSKQESTLQIIEDLVSYNERLEQRDPSDLDLIVLHCTELPTLKMAREFGERIVLQDKTGLSGHYYIDRDGKTYRYVSDDRTARHVIGFNAKSIGIEVINLGRYPNWFQADHQNCTEPYTPDQIESVRKLLRLLKDHYPNISKIARHSDLDVTWIPAEDDASKQIRRKVDPGPLFPWEEISSWWQELCRSYDSNQR